MKILVLNNAAPFIRGGAEELADNLAIRLNARRGLEAEVLRVPFRWNPAGRLPEEIWLNRNLRLYGVDRVIALKFPAYLIPHSCKTLWLLHQFRQAYDLYQSQQSHIGSDDRGRALVRLVREADNQCFRECKRIFANSPVTQSRLKEFNGFDSSVLYPPLNDPERFRGGEYGRYIFAGGRIAPGKRQHLLIEAMRFARSDLRLVIAGPLDEASYGTRLVSIVSEHGLEERVELRFGFRDRGEVAGLVNSALACAYLPIDEDSLGYVTMEAFAAAKAVLSVTDAGGLLEIVKDKQTGRVVKPASDQLAEAIDWLAGEPERAAAMGRAARASLEARGLTWDRTIDVLLESF